MKHNVIATKAGKVIVDKPTKKRDGDYVVSDNSVRPIFIDGDINTVEMLAVDQWYKVIGTINHSIDKNIAMVIVEDKVDGLELLKKIGYDNPFITSTEIWIAIEIHKASEQRGVYSEVDMLNAFMEGQNNIDHNGCKINHPEVTLSELIKSLNQEYIELETESDTTEIDSCNKFDIETGCDLVKCKCGNNLLLKTKTSRDYSGQLMAYVKK